MPDDINERVIDALSERIAASCRVLGLTVSILGHISAHVPGTDTLLTRAQDPQEPGVQYMPRYLVIGVGLDGKLFEPRTDG